MATNIIEGNPTKKFFIEMITRDISIEDAIIDLLDNSIDGANRINPNDYSGLNIYLIVNKDHLRLKIIVVVFLSILQKDMHFDLVAQKTLLREMELWDVLE